MRKAPALLPRRRARMSGVTLLEVMVVVSIVAILLSIGTASYKSISVSYRISGEINGLLGDMQFARSEAIRQGVNVVVCVSSTGTDCDGASAFNWNNGWIVFADPTGGKTTGGNAALVLRKQAAFTGGDTLTDSATSSVSFDREGMALGLLTTMSGAGGALIPLHDSTSNATRTRCLQVTNIGQVSVQTPTSLAACT